MKGFFHTTVDYPMGQDPLKLTHCARPKTFCNDFDEQLDIAEELYGRHLSFHFSRSDVMDIVNSAVQYPPEIRDRVIEILTQRCRKFGYLFAS